MFTTLTIQLNNIWAEDCIILRPIARVCRKSALYYNKYSLGQSLPLIYTTKSSYSGKIKRWHIIYFSLFMYYKIIISHEVTCKVNSTWPLQMKTTTDWVYIISFFFVLLIWRILVVYIMKHVQIAKLLTSEKFTCDR